MAVATASATTEQQVLDSLGFDYEVQDVPLSKINGDSSAFNYRLTRLDESLAIQYGIAMENGADFPPIVIHQESGISGYVIDSGVHRFHGRTSTNFPTIEAFVLKNVDLKDPDVVQKLDELRVILNLGHGRGLDQAERKLIACNWIASGRMDESKAAKFFDLDIKALREAFHNFELDKELRMFGLKPENFPRVSDKEAVLRKGLTQDDMRDVERLIVRYSSEDVRRKITGDQVRRVARDLSEARTHQDKVRVLEGVRAELSATRKKSSTNGSSDEPAKPRGQAHNPLFRLKGALANIETLDVNALLTLLGTQELGQQTYRDIKAAVDRLAVIENQIASKYNFPQIQVLP